MRVSTKDLKRRSETANKIESSYKIELLNCFLPKVKCTEHLNEINNNYINAERSRCEKDYTRSIKLLKKAYLKASELNKEATCGKCVSFFHQTIGQTLEDLNNELHNMAHGFISNKRYKPSYVESCQVINELNKRNLV